MKTHIFILSLFLLLACLFNLTEAQNIRNDTIYVSSESVAQIIFPSPGNGALPAGDGSYDVKGAGNTGLFIKATKKGVQDQPLIVNESGRTHQFILSYKEGAPPQRIDWSTKEKLKAHVKEKKDALVKALSETHYLYNKQLWEEAQFKYQRLSYEIEPNSEDANLVNFRLNEIGKHIQEIKQTKYNAALITGDRYSFAGKNDDAWKAYKEALIYKPKDLTVLKQIAATDTLRFYENLRKGDSAHYSRDYVLAKVYYEKTLNIDSVKFRPFLAKLNQVVKEAEYFSTLNKAKSLGDIASSVEEFNLAINEYQKASLLFDDRNFPKDRIKVLTKIRDTKKRNL